MDVNELSNAIRTLDGNAEVENLAHLLVVYAFLLPEQEDLAAEIIRSSPNKGAGALAEALIEGLGL